MCSNTISQIFKNANWLTLKWKSICFSCLKKSIIKEPQKSAVWGTRSDKPSVPNWRTSWQTRDTRDILFTVIQHYIDSGKGTALCWIKGPLKIHFAFGNNNEISVSIQAPVSIWPSFVWRHFVIVLTDKQEYTLTHRSLTFCDCQGNFESNLTS